LGERELGGGKAVDEWSRSLKMVSKKKSGKERRKQGKNYGTKRRELKQAQPLSCDTLN
jgi:hypothetical protein